MEGHNHGYGHGRSQSQSQVTIVAQTACHAEVLHISRDVFKCKDMPCMYVHVCFFVAFCVCAYVRALKQPSMPSTRQSHSLSRARENHAYVRTNHFSQRVRTRNNKKNMIRYCTRRFTVDDSVQKALFLNKNTRGKTTRLWKCS
jgi:hypothetical protein